MKFSTQSQQTIQRVLIEEFREQLEKGAIAADEIEQALRTGLQEIGQASFGAMLSVLDEHGYGIEEGCACQQTGKRVVLELTRLSGR